LFERSKYCKCEKRARSFGILPPKNESWRSRNLKVLENKIILENYRMIIDSN
jgi:hypothetical protein